MEEAASAMTDPAQRLRCLQDLLHTALAGTALRSEEDYQDVQQIFKAMDQDQVVALHDLSRQMMQQVGRHTEAEAQDILTDSKVLDGVTYVHDATLGNVRVMGSAPTQFSRNERLQAKTMAKVDLARLLEKLSKDEGSLKETVAGLQASLEAQDGKFANVPGMIMPVHQQSILWFSGALKG